MDKFSWSYRGINFTGTSWLPTDFNLIVVIVHGMGEHTGRYQSVAAHLNKAGFAVIGLDQFGHGRSDGKRGGSKGIDFCFDYMEAFLSELWLKYQMRIILYGQCMGGGIVSGLVLKRKLKIAGVIIASPAWRFPGLSPLSRLLIGIASHIMPDFSLKQRINPNKLSHNGGVVLRFRKDELNHNFMSVRLLWDLIRNGDWCLGCASRLALPALLVHGSEDAYTAVEASRSFADTAPSALITYREWQGGYHELHHDLRKTEVLNLFTNWINIL